jgi:hypothetical protein
VTAAGGVLSGGRGGGRGVCKRASGVMFKNPTSSSSSRNKV